MTNPLPPAGTVEGGSPCGVAGHLASDWVKGHFFQAMKPCNEAYDVYKCEICRQQMHSHRNGLPSSWLASDHCLACQRDAALPTLEPSEEVKELADREFLWRKRLWLNHARYLPFAHMPYGDDGEMQCCGIDFKREPVEEINRRITERGLIEIAKLARTSKSKEGL